MNNWGTNQVPLKYRMIEILWNFTTFCWWNNEEWFYVYQQKNEKKSFTHFSKHFPRNILDLYINV